MEPKRLYRSRENRVLCGVCGGIAEYFNVDPVLIRLGMVLFICASVGTPVSYTHLTLPTTSRV